jgi:hypothetical protein
VSVCVFVGFQSVCVCVSACVSICVFVCVSMCVCENIRIWYLTV